MEDAMMQGARDADLLEFCKAVVAAGEGVIGTAATSMNGPRLCVAVGAEVEGRIVAAITVSLDVEAEMASVRLTTFSEDADADAV